MNPAFVASNFDGNYIIAFLPASISTAPQTALAKFHDEKSLL